VSHARLTIEPITSIEIVINVNSGSYNKESARRRLTEIFQAEGIDVRFSLASDGRELVELARRAAKSSSQIVVAGGGDGTVNAVASVLVHTDKMLGVLPLGTVNHFAKDLHIPLDLEGSAETIIAGYTTKVDVGAVNGHIFVNNSSLGLYPRIVSERQKQQRLRFGKWPAFVWAAFSVLRRYPFLDISLIAAGKKFRSRTPFVFVGNNEYQMEGFNIGTRARLDAGVLSVYMTLRTGRLGLLRLALRAVMGGLRQEKDFLALTTREARIETQQKTLRVAMDGEVFRLASPLNYRLHPLALRVLVPEKKEP
jgi:YegS/Rv2252/BmrU family lipid kinase